MQDHSFYDLTLAVREAMVASGRGSRARLSLGFDIDDLPKAVSPRFATLLLRRARSVSARAICDRFLSKYDGSDVQIWTMCQEWALEAAFHDATKWPEALRVVRAGYENGSTGHFPSLHRARRSAIPKKIAKEICDTPEVYPASLVRLAESANRQAVGSRTTPVAKTAAAGGWFDDCDLSP
jgi:hypothetical protein